MHRQSVWEKRVASAMVGFGLILLVVALIAPAAGAEPNGNGAANGKAGSPPGLAKGHDTATTAGGANHDGPYSTSSTVTPSPSGNGNGGGNATGKPDAGTVGNTDDKNPPGQLPGPSDDNAGYECDTNHGIARGNPAHTGCIVTTSTTSPSTSSTSTTATTTTVPTTEVPSSVLGTEITQPPGAQVEGNALARTGAAPNAALTIAALALVAGGVAMFAAQRARRAAS